MEIQETFDQEKPDFQDEAVYQILVRGTISDALLQIADDMQIRKEPNKNVVSIIGWLPDQSALLGLLNALNDIRRDIISVRMVSTGL